MGAGVGGGGQGRRGRGCSWLLAPNTVQGSGSRLRLPAAHGTEKRGTQQKPGA